MSEQDLEYYRQRERMERKAAKTATSEAARRVHQELAQSYARGARSSPVRLVVPAN